MRKYLVKSLLEGYIDNEDATVTRRDVENAALQVIETSELFSLIQEVVNELSDKYNLKFMGCYSKRRKHESFRVCHYVSIVDKEKELFIIQSKHFDRIEVRHNLYDTYQFWDYRVISFYNNEEFYSEYYAKIIEGEINNWSSNISIIYHDIDEFYNLIPAIVRQFGKNHSFERITKDPSLKHLYKNNLGETISFEYRGKTLMLYYDTNVRPSMHCIEFKFKKDFWFKK